MQILTSKAFLLLFLLLSPTLLKKPIKDKKTHPEKPTTSSNSTKTDSGPKITITDESEDKALKKDHFDQSATNKTESPPTETQKNQSTTQTDQNQQHQSSKEEKTSKSKENKENPIEDFILIRTPSNCVRWDNSSNLYLSPMGEIEDFEFGEILKDEFSEIAYHLKSNSQIYALAANNFCHWTSLYNVAAGFTLGALNLTINNKQLSALKPPGAQEDWLGYLNSFANKMIKKHAKKHAKKQKEENYDIESGALDVNSELVSEDEALPNSFYPTAVNSDTNDNIFLEFPCYKLHKYFLFESKRLINRLGKNRYVKRVLQQINEEEKAVVEYLGMEINFYNIEHSYSKLLISDHASNWSEHVQSKKNIDNIVLLYHIFLYAKYTHIREVRNNVLRPFYQILHSKSVGFEDRRKGRKIKTKPRVMLFSATDTVFAALNSVLFGSNYKCFLKLLEKGVADVRQCPGTVISGSNLIFELFKPGNKLHNYQVRARIDGVPIELKKGKKHIEFKKMMKDLEKELISTRKVTCKNHNIFNFNIRKIVHEQSAYTSFLQLIFVLELVIVGYLIFDRLNLKDVQKTVEKVTEMVTSKTGKDKGTVRYARQMQKDEEDGNMGDGWGESEQIN